MLIRNVRVWPVPDGPGRDSPDVPAGGVDAPAGRIPVTDVRISDDTIAEVAPGLQRGPADEEVIDAEGCALLPGLHDHHVHLRALAAARASVPVGPPHVRTPAELAERLTAADVSAREGQWLRCTGYHESVAGLLDRYALDRLVPRRPVRVQHRTGALWIVNSAAAVALRLDDCGLPGVERDARGVPTGRLWRLDRWLADRVPSGPPDLGAVSAEAAALGITGFTDATPGATRRDVEALAGAVADGTIVQRLHLMASAEVPQSDEWRIDPAIGGPMPHPSGPMGAGTVTLGPAKIMLDDDTLPTLDELMERVREAHAVNRPVAVHCVTRVQLILTLTALDEAGRLPGDRIEHGAIIPAETIPALRGLTVVTQPHFATERAEQYARDVDSDDLPDLWRLWSLIDVGIAVAAGSDAPFGGADPWRVAVSASRRNWRDGENRGGGNRGGRGRDNREAEAISPGHALSLFFGHACAPATPRRIAPGYPADLVLLRVPPAEALRSLAAGDASCLAPVAATLVAGRRVH